LRRPRRAFPGRFWPFGHGRGHGHDGGGFGRRRGLYDSDELRLVLLSLIAEKPRHGYDLIKEIEERSGGTYTPSPGVIYPTLTMLQDMGISSKATRLARAKSMPRHKKAPRILPRTRSTRRADRPHGRAEIGAERRHRPVRRAMRNLYAALAEKLVRADSDETMHKIAALLDEVTQKIERS